MTSVNSNSGSLKRDRESLLRNIIIGDIFGSDTFHGDNHFSGAIVLLNLFYHMKGHVGLITFPVKTWFWEILVFMLLAIKIATSKTCFRHFHTSIKTSFTAFYLPLQWNFSAYTIFCKNQ